MAEQPCLPQVQACAIRIAKLNADGSPIHGAGNVITSDALVSMAVSPQYTDGDEITLNNACGTTVVNYKAADTFKRVDVTLTLSSVDPYLQSFLSGGTVLNDAGRIGFAAPDIGEVTGNGISIELWAKRIDDGDLDASSPYAWWVYPKVKNLRLGDFTHENGVLQPVYVGQAYQNDNWYDGPNNDWPSTSTQVYQWIPTDELPTVACGTGTVLSS